MKFDAYLSDLKNRYYYSDSLIKYLKHLIPNLIEYYGIDKKELILSSIDDTYIHFQEDDEDMYNYLKNYFTYKERWNFPYNNEVFLENEFILNNGIINTKYLIYVRQEFYGENILFDFNDYTCLFNLTKEICRLVKSYGTLKVGNNIKSKSGISNKYYKCDINNGLLIEDKVEYAGIEEAINTLEAEDIMHKMGFGYEKNKYYDLSNSLRILFSNDFIKDAFKASTFGGEFWINALSDDAISLANFYDEWLTLLNMPMNIIIMDDYYEDRLKAAKRNVDFIISKCVRENKKS